MRQSTEGMCSGNGRVAEEQVDDGQLRCGLQGGRRGLHFEGLLGLRETLKKKGKPIWNLGGGSGVKEI